MLEEEARFPRADSNGSLLAAAWQEFESTGEEEGRIWISLRTSRDGKSWETRGRVIGPVPYAGPQGPIINLRVARGGAIYLVLSVDDKTVEVYRSLDDGASFERTARLVGQNTVISPRIFQQSDGDLMLISVQQHEDTLTLFSSSSGDGEAWSKWKPLVTQEERRLNFLPAYRAVNGRDYLVFQSLYSGGRQNTYQLYLKVSDDGGETWSRARWLTGYEQPEQGQEAGPEFYDNQRAHLIPWQDGLAVAWERRYRTENPQIAFGLLDQQGDWKVRPETVTSGNLTCGFPRLLNHGGDLSLFWFDNRQGDYRIVRGFRQGGVWFDEDITALPGISTYPYPVMVDQNVYLVWENRYRERSRMAFMAPDRSVRPPVIRGTNFTAGRRSSGREAAFQWTLPEDSSGIRGFSYRWSRNPDAVPPQKLMTQRDGRELRLEAEEDGPWYLHVAAQDYAGNWSDPARITYFRDTTPPGAVVFNPPPTDKEGFLSSNTSDITWNPPDDPDVAGYSYELQYLGAAGEPVWPPPETRLPGSEIQTERETLGFINRDNGLWALSVRALDQVGNAGQARSLFFRMDKYIPVTYLSYVDAQRDELGRLKLRLTGRGFAQGGLIERIILDRDGAQPWDYTLEKGEGRYQVVTDRIIAEALFEEIEGGRYRVGVEHPKRGLAFTSQRLSLEPSGTVKFGDFRYEYQPEWALSPGAERTISANRVLLLTMMSLIGLLFLLSSRRLYAAYREGKQLEEQARALVGGYRLTAELPKMRMEKMKKLGMSLRIKFALWILSLVALIVMMVSLPLGVFMVRNQEKTLGEGLQQRSVVLLESLSSGARSYLPSGDVLELGLLPSQTSAMDEAVSATITGRGKQDARNFYYIWATNDPQIDGKLRLPAILEARKVEEEIQANLGEEERGLVMTHYLQEPDGAAYRLAEDVDGDVRRRLRRILLEAGVIGSVIPGETAIRDAVSPYARDMASEINTKAAEQVSQWTRELEQLGEEAREYALRQDAESRRILSELQDTITRLDGRINESLKDIGRVTGSYPPYDPENLSRDNTRYVFYKPIVYRKSGDNQNYYRGMVRLEVSTEQILEEIGAARNQLLTITGIIALIALILGVIGALILASITINPVKKLVRGVELIRDTEDKETLKDQLIQVKSRDELAQLADTINQMTEGLVKAAAASKDLTLGKEVQKMFIPLEVGSNSRKRTTGREDNEKVAFFGYYEGAKGVSGDYFDFQKLNDRYYAVIKCDVAGKGVPASLIMVEVATIFLNYFRKWDEKKQGLDLESLVYSMNDLLEERGFKGRFAALIVVLLDVKTGKAHMCNAGDNLVHYYNQQKRGMETLTIPETAAAGVFPSFLVDMKGPFKQVSHVLNHGDVMFLFTDGIEEAQRSFRNESFEVIPCEEPGIEENGEHDTHIKGAEAEELGIPRIKEIINAVFARSEYRLHKYHNPLPDEEFTFHFEDCQGTVEEAVLAMVSVEKIFRLYPDPRAGDDDLIYVDKNIDEFLRQHFAQYRLYFSHPADMDSDDYNAYSHLREDEQFDDLTILGIHRK